MGNGIFFTELSFVSLRYFHLLAFSMCVVCLFFGVRGMVICN